MIKLKNKPNNEMMYYDGMFFTFDGGKMYKYTDGRNHYVQMDGQWWKVSKKEYSSENDADVALFFKLQFLNGKIYERVTNEERMRELGLIQ